MTLRGDTMKGLTYPFLFCAAILLAVIYVAKGVTDDRAYDTRPPFKLDLLRPVKVKASILGKEMTAYNPKNPYNIFINYELGMHCVGFDISYCCIIPPYNSIQAQAVQPGFHGEKPRLLSPDDKVRLYYTVKDNSYSEGNKMKYWQVLKDVSGNGTMNHPGDNMANYVWDHLFIYKDLEGTIPENPEGSKRLHIGKEIPVNIDSGPSGKSLAGGYMDYAREKGGNIVFTDSLIPEVKDIPLTLTSSYLWDALGLPLTAFNDSRRRGTIRTVSDLDFQPYQYAIVQMRDEKGQPLKVKGKTVEFFGTEPVDISNCSLCHSGKGIAANISRGSGLFLFDREYAYWKTNYADITEYMARLSSATINILELHDKNSRTNFLRDYNPAAASNRLGNVGAVNCADCHGDNISGNLQSPRPGSTGYAAIKAKPLTEAVHSFHARFIPMPDKAGRTQSCQVCHPTHWQNEEMNDRQKNPHQITDDQGNPRFSDADLRTSGGGCFLRRDAHTNPHARPPFFLNGIGKWFLNEVSLKDESGRTVKEIRGLYCTNCHNHLTHELYRYDDLRDAGSQEGKTLRNKPIGEVINALAGGDQKRFRDFFADPVVGGEGDSLYTYYAEHKGAVLLRAMKEKDGKMVLFPWNSEKGETVTYASASGGNDWWLSAGEPHCANCHLAPFVESEGGKYFPIDQPNKYSLYRYSKAHGVLACQSCHESMHGLYPVRYEGAKETVDLTSQEQALQFSPDGKYAGPVTCSACHTVNKNGIPVQLRGTDYYNDYWASVVLIHFMREGDQKKPVAELMRKYPYRKAKEIVMQGWK
jgi:mono/diheme cytochrome c family protein